MAKKAKKSKAEKLTGKNIASFLSEEYELAAKTAREIVDSVVGSIQGHIVDGGSVQLKGLGVLSLKERPAKPARMGRNPATGEQIKLKAKPASKVVKFRPSKELKELIA